jgi:hypothetical protein
MVEHVNKCLQFLQTLLRRQWWWQLQQSASNFLSIERMTSKKKYFFGSAGLLSCVIDRGNWL